MGGLMFRQINKGLTLMSATVSKPVTSRVCNSCERMKICMIIPATVKAKMKAFEKWVKMLMGRGCRNNFVAICVHNCWRDTKKQQQQQQQQLSADVEATAGYRDNIITVESNRECVELICK